MKRVHKKDQKAWDKGINRQGNDVVGGAAVGLEVNGSDTLSGHTPSMAPAGVTPPVGSVYLWLKTCA